MGTIAAAVQFRDRLRIRIDEARAHTDKLLRIVRPEAFYDRSIPERHRIVFYLGHLEAFDWNLLRDALELRSFHPEFDRLFGFGIDPLGAGELPTDQPTDWPARLEIERYNQRVRGTIDASLACVSFDDPNQPMLYNGLLLEVAIEHRLMHAETLAYMLHQLSLDRKFSRPVAPARSAPPAKPRMVEIPAGHVTLGLPRSSNGPFGWDNEFEQHSVEVRAFAIDAYNVTNGEYLQFIREGGYEHRAFWQKADWEWRETLGLRHPRFWVEGPDGWQYRGMFTEFPLRLDWPVYVSHAEAAAYARWAGKALPTEAQFHRTAFGTPDGGERDFPWGSAPPDSRRGNFDFERWDPVPVGSYPAGNSAFGVADLVGNGWEWTRDVFHPFSGFQPFSFYPGYSADFFDGKHYVAKGASARTAACLLRRTFRNWFQPHYPYVYASFRCVSD